MLVFVFSVLDEIGEEECFQSDLYCVKLDVKPLLNKSIGSNLTKSLESNLLLSNRGIFLFLKDKK